MTISTRNYRILVIEDNPGDFVLVEDFLLEQIRAPTIVHAESYKHARDILCGNGQAFDIVLLDLSLNDRVGEDLIHDIVRICPDIPVIVLTGYADFSFGVRSLSMGIADYILKEELTALVLYKSIIYSAERKRIATALQDSEKRYSELFHLSPLPMWVYDDETLGFLDVNDAAIRHYGYSREEFLMMTIRDIRPEDEIGRLEEAVAMMHAPGQQHHAGLFNHRKKNGEIICVDIQSNRLKYMGRMATLVLANDVTERMRYIKAIEAQNRKLREISWLQSHVVRAPLSRIMGLVSIIKDADGNLEERDEMLGFLIASAYELDDVIRNISDLTQQDVVERAGSGSVHLP